MAFRNEIASIGGSPAPRVRTAADGNRFAPDRPALVLPSGAVVGFPGRPNADALSRSIPLFFIARNRAGLWVARDADGRAGGVFLLKASALRFARTCSGKSGCATMALAERVELDVENKGNRLIAWAAALLDAMRHLIPAYPPPVPLLEKRRTKERR